MTSSRQLWEVVGGKGKDGILVREAAGLNSKQLPERLSTGSVVRQVAMAGERMQFELVKGSGPRTGWVSLSASGNALLVLHCPVLVSFYSGGMTAAQGRTNLQFWLQAAADAGFQDTVIMDHPGEQGLEICRDWDDYISRLEVKIDEVPRHRGRRVMIIGHSHGCVAAHALAARLGDRCMKLYVIARRPPDLPLQEEVWGQDTAQGMEAVAPEDLLDGLVEAWPNAFLEGRRHLRPLPVEVLGILEVVRSQYSVPWMPCGFADQRSVQHPVLKIPIFAIAAKRECPKGETASKVQGWERLTSADFRLWVADETHMSVMSPRSTVFEVILEDMQVILQ